MTFLFLLLIGAAFLLYRSYNALRERAENVKRARANIDATMTKRRDIAQRLVDVARNYGDHEKLTQITTAELNNAGREPSDASIGQVVNQVQALALAYPDLKANQTYQQLMGQLEGLETTILDRREAYNSAVQVYNSYRSALPQLFFASQLGFDEAHYYQVDASGGDNLAVFTTDDGTRLRESMGRISSRMTAKRIAPVPFAEPPPSAIMTEQEPGLKP